MAKLKIIAKRPVTETMEMTVTCSDFEATRMMALPAMERYWWARQTVSLRDTKALPWVREGDGHEINIVIERLD